MTQHPVPSLREQLSDLTRSRIIGAAAQLIETGEAQVTFQRLSQLSGIPERTIYRHFPHKEAVLEAFWHWLNAELPIPASPEASDDLPAYVRALFAAFDSRPHLVRAMLASPSGRTLRETHAEARRAKFKHALASLVASLPDTDAACLLSAVEAICSAPGWQSLAASAGSENAADAAVWAVEALLARARASQAFSPKGD